MNVVSVCSLLFGFVLCWAPIARAEDAALAALTQKLSEGDEKTRLAAARSLEALGPAAKDAAASLVAALKDSSWDVRLACGDALLKLGADAIPTLLPALSDPNAEVRSGATWLLGRLKPECVPALLKALVQEKTDLRAGARLALEKIGPASIPLLLVGFKDADPDFRCTLAEIFGTFGAASKDTVPALIDALKSKPGTPQHERIAAIFTKIGPDAIPSLLAAFQNDFAEIRCGAVRALGFFSADDARIVPALVSALKDTTPAVRESAARALGAIGPAAAASAPALFETLKEERTEIRITALEALSHIDPTSKAVVAELIIGTKDQEIPVRLKSIDALSRAGASVGDAVPSLMECLKDDDNLVRVQALKTLALILPRAEAPDAYLTLLDTLQEKSLDQRLYALSALSKIMAASATAADAGSISKQNLPTVLAALGRVLKDDVPAVRAKAMEALAQNPAAAAGMIPNFIAALKDANVDVRQKAIEALAAQGSAAKPAVPALISALTDASNAKLIGETLAKIGLDPRTDGTLLLEAFQVKSIETKPAVEGRAQIAELLGSLGPAAIDAVPQLVSATNEKNPLGSEASAALKKIDPAAKATVPVLIAQMKSKVGETRLAAVEFCKKLGPQAAPAIPALIEALKDDEYLIREGAATALGLIAPPGKATVTALINAMKGPVRVARAASASLMKIEPESLPLLIPALKDDTAEVRRGVGAVLEKNPAAIPLLAAAMKENSKELKRAIATLVAQIGPPAKDLVPAMIDLLKESSSTTTALATKALESIGADAVPGLLAAMKDGSVETKKQVLLLIAQMGPAAKDAVPGLALALRDENVAVKAATLRALERLGTHAISGLMTALNNEDPEVRRMAISALGNLGSAAKSAVPSLLAIQKDENSKLRRYTVNSLRQIAPEDPLVMNAIMQAMKDEDPVVRMAAIKNLGSLGAAGKVGVPVLIEALRDEDWDNRGAAATALEDIGVAARKLFPDMDVATNEIRAVLSCIAYGRAQEAFHQKDYDRDGVLEYAQFLKSPDPKKNPGLCDAALLPRLFADAEGLPGGAGNYRGYRFKILKAQGESVPGGLKTYVENGNMVAGHALVAFPADYGKSGRSVFMINYTGSIFEKDFKSAEDTNAFATNVTEFKPDDKWTLTRQIGLFVPVRPPPTLKGMGEMKEDTPF